MNGDEVELSAQGLARLTAEVSAPGGAGDARIAKAFNAKMVEHLRAGGGPLAGEPGERDRLILTVTGRRSGRPRSVPLSYFRIDGRVVVIASMGGAERNPEWFNNICADARVTVEVDGVAYPARAVPTHGADRDQLFAEVCRRAALFAHYQAATDRRLPVVELRPS